MSDGENLAQEECEACKVGAPKVSDMEIEALLETLPGWEMIEEEGIKMLHKQYAFPNFVTALAFTNRIGAMAESVQHHPDILTSWGKVKLIWYTHKIGGLHRNDFRCAARSDQLVT
ncbi:MAG: 4a-hydroxytetrahydrobiopterin dehydratase [Neptuniibacter sp.]